MCLEKVSVARISNFAQQNIKLFSHGQINSYQSIPRMLIVIHV